MNFYKLSWQLTENCAAVWKTHPGKNKTVGAVILDLSKALDYILHDLIAKLDAYGFDKEALSLTYSYLKDRKQLSTLTFSKLNHLIDLFVVSKI